MHGHNDVRNLRDPGFRVNGLSVAFIVSFRAQCSNCGYGAFGLLLCEG